MKTRLAACVSLAALAASMPLATGAMAQTAEASKAAPSTELSEIIVTGEKFGRTLKDTATSVGYVSAADMDASAMLTGRDAFERLVNVNTAGANGRFAIRGVAFDNVTGAGFGALGTIYVDRVRMSDKSTRFGPDLLWDVQSVEVLRGAQSTLQGRNALAGAIYITSQDPSFDWRAKARIMLTNEGGRDYAVALGGPIVSDKLAFRLAAESHQRDGSVSNPVLKTDKVDYADDLQLRGKLLFKPTDALTVRLTVNYADIDRRDAPSDTRALGADGYLPGDPSLGPNFESGIAGAASADRRQTFVNVPEYDRTKTTAGAVTADWRLSPDLTLTAETTASYSDNYKQRDGDGGYYKYGYAGGAIGLSNPYKIGRFDWVASGSVAADPVALQQERYRQWSQELRLKYDADQRVRLLGGAYYTEEHEREDNFTLYVFRNVQPLVAATAAGYGLNTGTARLLASAYSNDAPLYTFNAQPVDVKNYAAYGEGEYDLTSRLTLNLGLRYDHENNTSGVAVSGAVLGLADPTRLAALSPALGQLAAGINTALNPFTTAQSSADQTFHAWLPKAGVRYHLSDDVTVGAVAQRAYRAGGVSVNVVRQLVTPLAPEFTWNYELYTRAELFEHRARVSANVYYVDWKDQQAVIDLSEKESDSIGVNAGRSKLYGFETQLEADVTSSFKVHAGLGYSHTEFTEFNVTLPAAAAALGIKVDPAKLDGLEGKSFAYAPRWTAVVGGTWRGARGAFASVNANYQGASYSDTANTHKNGARTLVSARFGADLGRVTVAAFARNLFDVDYVKDASTARPLLGEPRVVGVSLEARY